MAECAAGQHAHFHSYRRGTDALQYFGAQVLKLGFQVWLVMPVCDCLQVKGLPRSSLSPAWSPGITVSDLLAHGANKSPVTSVLCNVSPT